MAFICQMISLKSEPQPTTNDLPGVHPKSRIYRAQERNPARIRDGRSLFVCFHRVVSVLIKPTNLIGSGNSIIRNTGLLTLRTRDRFDRGYSKHSTTRIVFST